MRAHLSRVEKCQEINSYITYLQKNLTSHEGLTTGLGPRGLRGIASLQTIPRADTPGGFSVTGRMPLPDRRNRPGRPQVLTGVPKMLVLPFMGRRLFLA